MNISRKAVIFTVVTVALLGDVMTLPASVACADIVVQNNQSVAFMGDSITAFGYSKPAGYVNLVVTGLATNGITIKPVPAGVGGDTSPKMLARLQTDVISKAPDWMLLSCGVNDAYAVWNKSVDQNAAVAQYETNITSIVEQCQAAHIRLVLMTPTPIAEDWNSDLNKRLGVFNSFLRQLADQKGCILADVNSAMTNAIKNKAKTAYTFTVDNVHMDPAGDFVMASTVLRALGVTDAGIAKAKQQWLDIPAGVPVQVTVPMTARQWFNLQDTAAGNSETVPAYLADNFKPLVPPVGK